MMKRILWPAAGLLLALGLTACGGAKTADTPESAAGELSAAQTQGAAASTGDKLDAKGETLTVWMPTFAAADGSITDKDFWERELKPLADETGCTVKVEIVPWDSYEEKYLTGTSSGVGPDVGYMYMEMFYDYIHNGMLEDIAPYFTEADTANYLYYPLGNILGKQYALPVVVGNPRILIGNKKILQQAGIEKMPQTWEEFVADCKLVKEKVPGASPFVQDWGNAHYGSLNELYWPFFWSEGGEIVDADGNLTIDSEAGLSAAQFLYDLRFKDGILPDTITAVADTESVFKEGNTAFVIMASGNALRWKDIDWDYTTVLKSPKGGQKTFVAADSLVMLSSAKNKPLAAAAMKLITSTEVMSRFHKEISSQPPITKDEVYEGDNRFNELYLNEGEKFQTLPVFQGSAAMYDTLFKNLQQMMLGELSPQEVLSQTTDYYNTSIKE